MVHSRFQRRLRGGSLSAAIVANDHNGNSLGMKDRLVTVDSTTLQRHLCNRIKLTGFPGSFLFSLRQKADHAILRSQPRDCPFTLSKDTIGIAKNDSPVGHASHFTRFLPA